CPLYSAHAGTHTGCHLRDLSALGFCNYFLLNGTSPGAAIQFMDSIWNTKQIERLNPPDNVTVHCNASHCRARWMRPRTWTVLSSMDFLYEVDVQRWRADLGSGTPLVQVAGEEEFGFPSPQPRARQVLRLRLACTAPPRVLSSGCWSPWGRAPRSSSGLVCVRRLLGLSGATGPVPSPWPWPQHPVLPTGSDAQDAPTLRLYVLVVLLTLVCTLLLGFLFTRFIWIHGLCPPGPKIKMMDVDKVNQEVPWEDNAPSVEKGEQEEVLTVEEVS
ncbi:granulocyte-macrophage colony-stimulating factor receptor subunit alpha, partial [Fukomys damarensis]|uniref:granulocyte-macrophage colony-stimulating factor receptor subunit alpha n=1 Tax=Fukomys damarensis TaxID=885580 RepID=UPI001455A68D